MRKNILLYGAGGVGKTSAMAGYAKFLWKTTGQKALIFSADPGGYGPFEEGAKAGAVEFHYMRDFPNPMTRMRDIVVGRRPGADPKDPKAPWTPVDFAAEKIGFLGIEGLTSWSEVMLNWAIDEHSKGRQVGQMDGKSMFFKDEESTWGASTQAHYGIAQDYMRKFVGTATQLWRQLNTIIWTALETKTTLKDASVVAEGGKGQAYGPKLAGTAATGLCIPWFTDVIHIDRVGASKQADGTLDGERKFFLDQHYAPGDPIPYLAKASVSPDGKMPKVLAPSFEIFFNELSKAAAKDAEGWKKA
jgi:hypothetical protein